MSRRHRFISASVLLTVAMVTLLAACSSASAPQQTAAPKAAEPTKAAPAASAPTVATAPTAVPAKTVRFAASLPASDNPWWVSYRKTLEQAAAEKKVEVKVAIANEDAAKQLTDIEDLIQSKPDALIVGPVDMVASAAPIDKAADLGIPVFVTARESKSEKTIATIAGPEEDLGRGSAAFVGKLLTSMGGGEVVHLRGAAGVSYAQRQQNGFDEEIKKYPAVKVVAQLAGRDNRAEGMKLMEDALQRWPNVKAVVGCNDEVSLGAIGAIEAAGKGLYPKDPKGIVVTGNTGNLDGIKAIQEGRMAYLGMKAPNMFASTTFQVAYDYVVNNKKDVKKVMFTDVIGVTKENVNDPKIKAIWEAQ